MTNVKHTARHRKARRPILPVGEIADSLISMNKSSARPVAIASATGLALTAVVTGSAQAAAQPSEDVVAPATVEAALLPTTVSVPDIPWAAADESVSVVAEAPVEVAAEATIEAAAPAAPAAPSTDEAGDSAASSDNSVAPAANTEGGSRQESVNETTRQAIEEAASRDDVRADVSTEAPDPAPAAPASANGSSIVSIAMGLLGIPYVWGGSTPAGFDCSGFTQYVYAQAGISIPRTSGAQGAAGTKIYDISQAQPGDLVWHAYGHVGIYAGDGMVIEATTPGEVTQIQPIWGYDAFIRY